MHALCFLFVFPPPLSLSYQFRWALLLACKVLYSSFHLYMWNYGTRPATRTYHEHVPAQLLFNEVHENLGVSCVQDYLDLFSLGKVRYIAVAECLQS